MKRTTTAALAALVAAGLAGAAPPAALGHAALAGASPPPGARVQAAPARIELRFTEPLRRELSSAELTRAGGASVPARVAVRGRVLVLAPEDRLRRGAYTVRWRTVSTQDAHPLEGSFGFGVRAVAAAGTGSLERSPLAGGGWARALTRGLFYCALLLFAGALLGRGLLGREWPAREEAPGTRRRADAVVMDAGLAAAALGAIAAVVDAADAAGRLSLETLRVYLLSGAPGIARVALVALVGLALALAHRAPRAAALAAVVALGCVVASGHANSADPRGLAIVADWVHLAAGALWLGGAATILAVWGPSVRDRAARAAVGREVMPRFGRIALPAFLAVAVAGGVNALLELSSVADLWDSAYGRVLAVKAGLVAAAAGAAWAHAYRRRPPAPAAGAPVAARADAPGAGAAAVAAVDGRRWRALRAEVGLGAAVTLAAGLLVAFPLPPRQLDAAGAGREPVAPCDPCPLPAPRADELAVAGPAGSHVVAAWLRRGPDALRGTLRTLDSRGRPGAGAIEVPGGGARPCGRGCATFHTAPAPAVLRVIVRDRGRAYTATLPARWRAGEAGRARRLLARAQATMRRVRSVREDEVVSSGPGMRAITRYRLAAPDRLAFATGRGVRTVWIGKAQWLRVPGSPWRRSAIPGGVPFRTRSWFRWSPYARTVQLLGRRGALAELALADPATPVWIRLTVDTRAHRVLRERIAAPARFIDRRFHDFGAPLRIAAPTDGVAGG